jgi:hypothetical protein
VTEPATADGRVVSGGGGAPTVPTVAEELVVDVTLGFGFAVVVGGIVVDVLVVVIAEAVSPEELVEELRGGSLEHAARRRAPAATRAAQLAIRARTTERPVGLSCSGSVVPEVIGGQRSKSPKSEA